jgi:predicted nucleic acid-binding protein
MIVLLDTGPIVALLDRDQPEHERCMAALHTPGVTMVTCDAVITEACFLLRRLKGAQQDLLSEVDARRYASDYQLSERASFVAKLMAKYADVPMDLADACLVDLATIHNTGRIFTLDADFRIYRWGRHQPFELLIEL